jgi:ATPase subunit of ABC transporter with duplicated ATPase domains
MNIVSPESITKQYADRPLFEQVTLGIEAGDRIGLVGVNGSGKTTLLRIVAGAEQADSGRVSMARDLRVAYLPQNPALDPDLTVIEQIFRGDAPEIRLLREYERLGLIYTLGRSEGNYRLFDETALWCVRQVTRARALGLTLKEIREVCDAYLAGRAPFGVLLKEKLDAAGARVDRRLAELQAQRARIAEVSQGLASAIARGAADEFLEPDPRRTTPRGPVTA